MTEPDGAALVAAELSQSRGAAFRIPFRTWVPESVHTRRPAISLLRRTLGGWPIKVKGGIRTCLFYGMFLCPPRSGLTRLWTAHVRETNTKAVLRPVEVLTILTEGTRSTPVIRIRARRGEKFDYYNIVKFGSASSLVSRRTICFDTRTARHHLISKEVARKDVEDAGPVGMILVRNALVLYTMLGLRRVTLHAGLSAGGAVWPKLGFRPISSAEWIGTHAHIRRRISDIPEPGQSRARALVEPLLGADPRLIFSVSALRQPVQGLNGRKLGDHLLGGSRWEGELDLTDVPSRRLSEAYFRLKNLDTVEALVASWPNRASGE